MTTKLDQLRAQADAATAPDRPPFDRQAAMVEVIAKHGRTMKGAEMAKLVDKMEAEHQGKAPRASAQTIVRHHMGKTQALRREMAKELRAIGYRGRYASAGEVLNLMAEAHDLALDESRPSARAILRQQVGEQDAARLATTKSRHVKDAMRKLVDHPTARLMEAQGMRTARDVSEISKATLAGGVAALYQRAEVAKRLAAQDDALADIRARLDAAEAKLAQHDARLGAVEQGVDWKAAAIRLKATGLNAGDIARRLGQKYETVRKHLQRNA